MNVSCTALERRQGIRPGSPEVRDGLLPSWLTMEEPVPTSLRGAVLLLGNFDGFHRGHQSLLRAAWNVATRSRAPVGVMSVEPHPRTLFGASDRSFRLTCPGSKRDVFGRFGLDFVFGPRFDRAFAAQTPEEFAQGVLRDHLGVSHVVCGQDFRFGAQRVGDVAILSRLGRDIGFGVTSCAPVSVDDVRCSSSLVRDLLTSGDIRAANRVLGYPWSFRSRAGEATETGLRLRASSQLIRLPDGTYAASFTAAGSAYPGILSISTVEGRPDYRACLGAVLPHGTEIRSAVLARRAWPDD